MAGHSKWANIKHKKARTDAQKGKIFTKLGREIIVAAKAGGGDPNTNFRLKVAVENARAANMPNDTIQRAIQKGTGAVGAEQLEELRYEGYAPGGVAVMVDVTTDNRNRTAGEMRHLFSKNGGNMGEEGSVSWMFSRKGQISVTKEALAEAVGWARVVRSAGEARSAEGAAAMNEDEFMMLALEAGALDIDVQEENFEVFTEADDMEKVLRGVSEQGIPIQEAQINLIPGNLVEVADMEQARKIITLIEALEDHDDVQKVSTNFELADSLKAEDL
ncbi:MAG: YebC/PmpR family DNA-binding transcriptional regulator [Peptococcaceae bacterium]|nr:YebC/PmpR family DNA-binding transcriptional regulator [Peptococcaceae bacterium]